MSTTCLAPHPSSPAPSVRSRGPSPHAEHDAVSAPSAEPETIGPSPGIHGDAEQEHVDLSGSSSGSRTQNGLDGICGDDGSGGSSANTPRLPPTRYSKNNLDSIPSDPILSPVDISRRPQTQKSISHTALPVTSSNLLQEQIAKENDFQLAPTLQHKLEPKSQPEFSARANFCNIDTSHEKVPTTIRQNQSTLSLQSIGKPAESAQAKPFEFSKDHKGLKMEAKAGARSSEVHNEFSSANARHEAFDETRQRSSSRGRNDRVDKRIEATLTQAESSSMNRSRKSSHVMGLFREHAGPHQSKAEDTITKGYGQGLSNAEITPSPGPSMTSSEDNDTMEERDGANMGGNEHAWQHAASSSPHLRVQREGSSSEKQVTSGSNESIRTGEPRETSKRMTQSEGNQDRLSSKQRLPTKLLEEIRGYHNLAAPVHDKFRSGQAKVSPAAAGKASDKSFSKGSERQSHDEARQRSTSTSEGTSKVADEEEESDKEQIASALYYPHQAPSPEALQDVSIDDARKAKDAQEEFSAHLPEPAISVDGRDDDLSDHVDIALQSQNQSRYLHGDIQRGRPTAGDSDYAVVADGFAGSSSASESEYESQDDLARPSPGDDSTANEDPEATPRASPTTKKSYLRSRYHKTRRVPVAPISAVELKPYNHQVGGHTKVFRFSKRAVCKQLSNRENVFYEEVEHQHPELLKFMPR